MSRELSIQYGYPELCLSLSFHILSRLAAEECSTPVLEDLSELPVLLCELSDYKTNTVGFDRTHPLPTAYVVTPKLWKHYKNIDYISVSLRGRKAGRQEPKKL